MKADYEHQPRSPGLISLEVFTLPHLCAHVFGGAVVTRDKSTDGLETHVNVGKADFARNGTFEMQLL